MKTKAGLWIDHRSAVVVVISDRGEEMIQITSDAEKQLRRTGNTPLQGNYEAQKVPSDETQLRVFNADLKKFYDEVIDSLNKVESVFIMGPGVAKNELKIQMEENNLGERIVSLETTDNLTDPQIAAKVREFFKA